MEINKNNENKNNEIENNNEIKENNKIEKKEMKKIMIDDIEIELEKIQDMIAQGKIKIIKMSNRKQRKDKGIKRGSYKKSKIEPEPEPKAKSEIRKKSEDNDIFRKIFEDFLKKD